MFGIFNPKKTIKKLCVYNGSIDERFDTIQVLDFDGKHVYFGRSHNVWYELDLSLTHDVSVTLYCQVLPTNFTLMYGFLEGPDISRVLEKHRGVWFPYVK